MDKNSTQLDGALIVDKPAGITSHDVVARIRRLIQLQPKVKVGHSGTLDPFATGVLVVAIGKATRLLEYTHSLRKTYEAEITLGATSDTDDRAGRISKFESRNSKQFLNSKFKYLNLFRISDFVLRISGFTQKRQPTKKEVVRCLKQFIGHISQIPPAYSAIKIKGQKMYELARAGREVKASPRPVTIHSIELLKFQYPKVTIRVVCNSGTYIRALARDIGSTLNTGGYCETLCRTAIGPFAINKSISLEKLSTAPLPTHLLPTESLVSHLPRYTLADSNVAKFKQGQGITLPEAQPRSEAAASTTGVNKRIAIFDSEKNLIAIGRFESRSALLFPEKVL